MQKTIIGIIIVLVIGFGIYYVVSKNGSDKASTDISNTYTPPVTTNPNTDTSVSTPTSSSVTVNIKDFAFSPATLNIKTGTKVTWTNNDSAPHTVTADLGNPLDSGTISPGQSFSFTFTNSGSINYHCSIHPMMKGSIVVQ